MITRATIASKRERKPAEIASTPEETTTPAETTTPDEVNHALPLIAVISLTQNDGLVLNEWTITPSGVYQAYEGGIFCDIAKLDIPPGCSDLVNVTVTVPVLE